MSIWVIKFHHSGCHQTKCITFSTYNVACAIPTHHLELCRCTASRNIAGDTRNAEKFHGSVQLEKTDGAIRLTADRFQLVKHTLTLLLSLTLNLQGNNTQVKQNTVQQGALIVRIFAQSFGSLVNASILQCFRHHGSNFKLATADRNVFRLSFTLSLSLSLNSKTSWIFH